MHARSPCECEVSTGRRLERRPHLPPIRLRVCGCEIMMSDEGRGPRYNDATAIWSPTLSRKIQLDKSIHSPTSSARRPSRSVSVSPSPFLRRLRLRPQLHTTCVAAVPLSAGHSSVPLSARARSPTRPPCPSVRPPVRPTSKQRHRCLRRFSRGRQVRRPPGLPPSFLPHQARQTRHSVQLSDKESILS